MRQYENMKIENISNRKRIYAYIQASAAFNALVFFKIDEYYIPIEGALISNVNIEPDAYFEISSRLDIGNIFNNPAILKLSLETSYLEFSTDIIAIEKEKNIYRFRLPEKIVMYYERKHERATPTDANPVRIEFLTKRLKGLSAMVVVKDISVGGAGLAMADAESIFKSGDIIDDMIILLPGEGECRVSAKIRYSYEDRCGIEFITDDRQQIDKIRKYINQKKVIENVHRKTYKAVTQIEKVLLAEETQQKKKKILIVDDSMSVQQNYYNLLTGNNYVVIKAINGLEGIKKSIEELPDLILMDINMPQMNGIECSRIIKNHPLTKKIRICMFTSEDDKDTILNAVKIGISDYIVKSLEPQKVLERIEKLLK